MQEIVCNRASSVGIPTALDAEKVREINDFLLDIMGRRNNGKDQEERFLCHRNAGQHG